MKYIKLFEEWSPNFNRTLQGAYQTSLGLKQHGDVNKKAKEIENYANRSISQEVFSVVVAISPNSPVEITHDPEFILKPIETFIKENGDLSKDKNYLVIPINVIGDDNNGYIDDLKGWDFANSKPPPAHTLMFKDGKIYSFLRTRTGSYIPEPKHEIRFSNRKNIEDFFAMTIQAILSSPEESDFVPVSNPHQGDTEEKQIILGLIQKIILEKDMRQYTI
jgi:hypothetical protein